MSKSEWIKALTASEHRFAWMVAVGADFLQVVAFPFFAPGAVSPADDILDLVVGGLLIRSLGWHWAFLPTFAAELVPGLDLFPTWTAAVLYVTRQRASSVGQEQEVLPPGPAPAPRP